MDTLKNVIIRKTPNDRRKKDRTNERLKFRLIPNGSVSNFQGQTNNLSCLGANCQMNKYISELSKVELTLDIASEELVIEGIVVRTTKVDKTNYNISIYFDNINEVTKLKLENFVTLKSLCK